MRFITRECYIQQSAFAWRGMLFDELCLGIGEGAFSNTKLRTRPKALPIRLYTDAQSMHSATSDQENVQSPDVFCYYPLLFLSPMAL